MDDLEFHELAGLFPLMTGDESKTLGDDIKVNGQHEPIWLYEDKVLDGRNRYLECIRVGVEPTLRPYLGDDPLAFVISLNLKRRHLDESQRAVVASKLANMPSHRPDDKSANLRTSQAKAAKRLNVSPRSVSAAKAVRRDAIPDVVDAVEQGKVSVSAAAHFAKEVPPLDQARLIAEHGSPAKAVKAANADRRAASKRSAVTEMADRAEQTGAAKLAASKPKLTVEQTAAAKPKPDEASTTAAAKLIDLIEHFGRVNVSATVARMSNDDRITLITQIVRANSWLNKTAVEIAVAGGANLGTLAPVSLRLEALEFLKAAAARIEAGLAGRAVATPGTAT